MPWIKICGLTTRAAIDAAVDAGADAIGFVFAPSSRQVSVQQAHELVRGGTGEAVRVAVMQHPSQAMLDEVCSVFRPDVIQTDAEDFAYLNVPKSVHTLPVIRDGCTLAEALPTRLLYEGRISGTGAVADWEQAQHIARRTQLVLAGGLQSANIGAAIAAVRPFGVDVSSGVESAPGVKDPIKIREFVRAARAADDGPSLGSAVDSKRS